jgi:hypothetical protein
MLMLFSKLEHFIMLNYVVNLKTYFNNSLYLDYMYVMCYFMLLLL